MVCCPAIPRPDKRLATTAAMRASAGGVASDRRAARHRGDVLTGRRRRGRPAIGRTSAAVAALLAGSSPVGSAPGRRGGAGGVRQFDVGAGRTRRRSGASRAPLPVPAVACRTWIVRLRPGRRRGLTVLTRRRGAAGAYRLTRRVGTGCRGTGCRDPGSRRSRL